MTDAQCPKCGGTDFRHVHDAAHGIPGTHMDGSERFICTSCDHRIYARDPGAHRFTFILDKPIDVDEDIDPAYDSGEEEDPS